MVSFLYNFMVHLIALMLLEAGLLMLSASSNDLSCNAHRHQ